MKSKLIIIFFGILFTSCSSYLNSIYKDFDNQERLNADIDNADDGFGQFRKTNRRTSSEYNKPNKMISTANQKVVEPQVHRQYKEEKTALKRFTASDLTDNGSDGSLWGGSDPNSFLFSQNKTKSAGDIVQINVGSKLKEEITMELKRAFPDNPFEAKAEKEAAKNGGADKKPVSVADGASNSASGGADIKDKISSVIVEEINREHLLVKGRKNVLFKNRKRMIEVQALVSRKDITDDDSLNSDQILETNVSVVR